MLRVTFSLLLTLLIYSLLAQPLNLGIPLIQNLDKQQYGGGTRTWEFCQGDQGRIYAANNDGVLVFDGVAWRTYSLPNRTIVRSVIWHDGQLWAGGQNELGYFASDASGDLQFHSLLPLVPKEASGFADVWKILPVSDGVLIRTSLYLMKYSSGQVTLLGTKGDYIFMGESGSQVVIQERDAGILRYDAPGTLSPLSSFSFFSDKRITGVIPLANTQLVFTSQAGVWQLEEGRIRPWQPDLQPQLSSWRIAAVTVLEEGRIAIGTERAGILIFDSVGRLLQQVDRTKGLQNNRVLSCFVDAQGTLWAGLDYGISFLATHSTFSFLSADGDLQGATYSVKAHNGYLYVGTSSGLYGMPLSSYQNPLNPAPWQLIPGTDGQVWGMDTVAGRLWLAHNEGAFEVSQLSATPIAGTEGIWTFRALPQDPTHMVVGTYAGLGLINLAGNRPTFTGYIKGFEASSRFVLTGHAGEVWVSHPYRGVFRIEVDIDNNACRSVRRYGPKEGLPSDLMNHIFALHEGMVVAGETGLFQFSPEQDRFVPMRNLHTWLPAEDRIVRLVEDAQENIWYLTEQEAGVLWIKDRGIEKEIIQQQLPLVHERMVAGFEYLYPMDKDHVFFGLEQGLMYYQARPDKEDQLGQTLITEVQALLSKEQQQQIGAYGRSETPPTFSSNAHTLRFRCGASYLSPLQAKSFRYRLKGLDEDWSAWTSMSLKEYTQVGWGDFVFEAQARTSDGQIAAPVQLAFRITTPWYASRLAKSIYGLLCIGFIFTLIFVPRRQFEKEKAELEDEHREQVAQNQAEINSLREEKLTAEIGHKTRELATATMHLVQKNELITRLNQEISQIISQHPDHPSHKALKQIQRTLSNDKQFEEDWDQFATHFDKVHANFLRRLKEAYPNLTPKDQRMCAYLRLNLSTKEIAPLMNISVRGVEISRYRLRKKLNLEREVNLSDFIMNF